MSGERMAWRARANCVGRGALFFDDGREAEAKRVCATCPVMVECLEHALNRPERHGVWGGKTVKERRRMAFRRAAGNGGDA